MMERNVRFGFKYRSARKTLKGSFKSAIPWLRTQDFANDENITGSRQAQMGTNETQMGSGGEPNRVVLQVQRERNIGPDTDQMQQLAFSVENGKEDMTSIFIERTCRQEIAASEENLSGVSMGKNVEKGDDKSWSVGALPSRLTIRQHGQPPTGATLSNPDP